MMVTVYTKPDCVQCKMTFKALAGQGTAYRSVDVMESDENYRAAQRYGYSAMPIVVAGDESWAGFKLDRIRALRPVSEAAA